MNMKRYIAAMLAALCTVAVTVAATQTPQQAAAPAATAAQTDASDSSDATPAAEATEAPAAEADATAIDPATATSDELWQAGNAAYTAGDFARAAELYKTIADKGLYSAPLYYNLANALFKSGETGGAILYYNRALRLAPGDEDIRHNLEYAERSTKDKIEEIPEFFLVSWAKTVRSTMSCTAWTILSARAAGRSPGTRPGIPALAAYRHAQGRLLRHGGGTGVLHRNDAYGMERA